MMKNRCFEKTTDKRDTGKQTFVFLTALFLLFAACKRDQFYSGGDLPLRFSADTVLFDTIFSTIGTPTLRLMVYNPHKESVKISKIWLGKGDQSSFKININGLSANSEQDVEIEPEDSLYIFIQALGNTNGIDLPVLIRDSILFQSNNQTQHIKLLAYNQDVNLLNSVTLKTQTWEGDKPYLIYGDVTVDTLETLTIKKGITVYFHWNANLIVKGTLRAEGEFEKPVTFRDDRMGETPGQWGGILLRAGSSGHDMNYVVAKNGTSGIRVGDYGSSPSPDIEMKNVIVQNMLYNCLLAVNANVTASNSVFANGGTYTCGLANGGNYAFYHCTFANYYNTLSANGDSYPAVYFSNYYSDPTDTSKKTSNTLNANFVNSIIYGNMNNEVELDSVSTTAFNYQFSYCLIRGEDLSKTATTSRYTHVVWNKDPLFVSENDPIVMEVDSLSPAKKAGNKDFLTTYPYDLKMKERAKDTIPTVGAYE